MKRKLLIHMIPCWIAIAASARTVVLPPLVSEQVDVYVATDQPVAVEQGLLSHPDSDAVVNAALDLLDTADISTQARNRLWKLIASARGDYGATRIARDDRIAALAEALTYGNKEAQLAVIQRIVAVQPSKRAALVQLVNSSLPSAADAQIVTAGLFALAMTRSLSEGTEPYVEGLAMSLDNANVDLKGNFSSRAIANPDFFEGSDERQIRTAAVAACIASAPTVADALEYIGSFSQGTPTVLDAMVIVGNSEILLTGADLASRVAWLEEYAARFCAAGCESHREKYSLSYIVQMYTEFGDMRTPILQAVDTIDQGCGTTNQSLRDAAADLREFWMDP